MGRSIAPSANICNNNTTQQTTDRKAVKKHMAKLVKKGTKGTVGSVVGPAEKPVEGIAEIDFGTPTTAPVTTKRKSKYPIVEGPTVEKLVDRIVDLNDKFDAVNDPFKAAKLELIELAFPQFFSKNEGKVEAPSSMVAFGKKGAARVTFKDQFTPGDKQKLIELLAPTLAGKWFRQHWIIKVDSDQIPAEKGAALVEDLKAVMAKHGVSHALEIKASILPSLDFAAKRHHTFEPETNMKINEIVPQRAAVSTKGVK